MTKVTESAEKYNQNLCLKCTNLLSYSYRVCGLKDRRRNEMSLYRTLMGTWIEMFYMGNELTLKTTRTLHKCVDLNIYFYGGDAD